MRESSHEADVQLTEDSKVSTTMKTFVAVIASVLVVGGALTRWEFKLQAAQDMGALHTTQLGIINDNLSQLRADQKVQASLLNYIAYGRKGEPPPKADEGH